MRQAALRELHQTNRCAALAAVYSRASLTECVCVYLSATAQVRRRLNERLTLRYELAAQVDKERLEQELALLLQHLVRGCRNSTDLCGHVDEIRRATAGTEPAGRRLDFLMQELNREANTLSSKSQDLETTRAAVEMKVIIEQMREQVQNVE